MTIALPIVGFVFLIMTVANYLTCAFTDPGFYPRSSPQETLNTEKENQLTVDLGGVHYPTPKNKVVELKDSYYDMKFCVNLLKYLFGYLN